MYSKVIQSLFLIGSVLLILSGCSKEDDNPGDRNSGTFTDSRDQKTYGWVKIGNQTWMADNLAYKPSSGDYWSYNNDANNVSTYGYLYSWETAQTVAPAGWHLPSEAEWEELANYLGTNHNGGGKMKEEGTTHWLDPNIDATNASGFSALPGGGRFFDSDPYKYFGEYAYFWSATESVGYFASYFYLYNGDEYLHTSSNAMQFGFSVRCIKND